MYYSNNGYKIDKSLIGKIIKIIYMDGEPNYDDRVGEVRSIDDMGQLHGTWGGLAVNPRTDRFDVVDWF